MSPWLPVVVFCALVLLGWWLSWRGRARPLQLEDQERPFEGEVDDGGVGVIEIEDAIDLHGFQPREIPSVVESYLEAAVAKGYREVRLIHGRGKGVQRRRVQELLSAHPAVKRFGDAPGHRGGWGATIAWLRLPEDD